MEELQVIIIDRKKALAIGIILGLTIIIAYTYIGALLAFVAPSETFPLRVTELDTLDENNVTEVNFDIGDDVRVNVTVEKAEAYYINFPISYDNVSFFGDTTFRIIVTILDEDRMPVSPPYSETSTIAPGSSSVFTYNYTIPPTAATGTYTIRAMVWSDWLPDGLALSNITEEVTFDVS